MDFSLRLQQEDFRLKDLLEQYLETSVNTSNIVSQTTLTFLIITTNTVFKEDEYRCILRLGTGKAHSVIFQEICKVVSDIARAIYYYFGFDTLLEIPLTNLKDVSYQIALTFKDIFLVPVYGYVYDINVGPQLWGNDYSPKKLAARIIKYISRFNEMWIITSMLNKEYTRLVKSYKSPSSL